MSDIDQPQHEALRRPSALGVRIRATREELDYSQNYLAQISGIDQQLISRLEIGVTKSSDITQSLADALLVNWSWLRLGQMPKRNEWQDNLFNIPEIDYRKALHRLRMMQQGEDCRFTQEERGDTTGEVLRLAVKYGYAGEECTEHDIIERLGSSKNAPWRSRVRLVVKRTSSERVSNDHWVSQAQIVTVEVNMPALHKALSDQSGVIELVGFELIDKPANNSE